MCHLICNWVCCLFLFCVIRYSCYTFCGFDGSDLMTHLIQSPTHFIAKIINKVSFMEKFSKGIFFDFSGDFFSAKVLFLDLFHVTRKKWNMIIMINLLPPNLQQRFSLTVQTKNNWYQVHSYYNMGSISPSRQFHFHNYLGYFPLFLIGIHKYHHNSNLSFFHIKNSDKYPSSFIYNMRFISPSH